MPMVSARTTTTTAATPQRSTRGCWTCRLRRKKCDENGMPCQTCASRDLYCHGYGPRPAWKDRGEKERQQAQNLNLRRASTCRTICVTDRYVEPSPPTPQLSLPSPRHKVAQPYHTPATSPTVSNNMIDQIESLEGYNDALCSPSISDGSFDLVQDLFATFLPDFQFAEQDTQMHGTNATTALISPASLISQEKSTGLLPSSETVEQSQASKAKPETTEDYRSLPLLTRGVLQGTSTSIEREAGLVTYYLTDGFKQQFQHYATHRLGVENGWLLLFLMRSTAFYYASLSISSFYLYSSFSAADTESRDRSFLDFQNHRVRAIVEMRQLSDTHHCSTSPSGFLKATELQACAMQLTFLELLSSNGQHWQTYFETATLSFHCMGSARPATEFVSGTMTTSPCPSSIEQNALELFHGIIVWADILSFASTGIAPVLAATYRQALSRNDSRIKLESVVGCENWVILNILEIAALDEWKMIREAEGTLSIHELVRKSQEIETALQTGIETILVATATDSATCSSSSGTRSKSTGSITYIFACAALVYLHTVVSGPSPGVPEVRQSVAKVISAFRFLPNSCDLRCLLWPYCISGCMAIMEERDSFRALVDSVNPQAQSLRSLTNAKAILEDCWAGTSCEGRLKDSSCDWRASMKRLDLRALLIWT